ncbi:MAG TPA: hypothetical protein VNV36_03425 [Pseudomonas sp.]|uniref:hypothetical protein n=1 Tax=Pseudomonas sp. TaxID=306 RepID=UPI002C7E2CC6|nr:hypothetical protein [Pseudomonas sp.]HWH85805.1 hypothetical protein [Pseudomonas sp.]
MTGKPPKVKPLPSPTKTLDFSIDGPDRPSFLFSTLPHLTVAHGQAPDAPSFGHDWVSVMPAVGISASPISTTAAGFAALFTNSSLADYRIPTPKGLGEPDAQGVWNFKQRQYVTVADDHIVQVVRDAESGLFRATQAGELHPSGPLLEPGTQDGLWFPLDSGDPRNRPPGQYSKHSHTTELIRRTGYSVDDFSPVALERILAVSGVDTLLAQQSSIHPESLALLQDTLRRFTLDQNIRLFITKMQHSDPSVRAQADPQLQALLPLHEGDPIERGVQQHRAFLFQESERAFELDCDENTLRMRRIFPQLPKTTAQALWRQASASDHLHLRLQPGMPRHMAEKTLLALRNVRLARACEGIFLDSVSSLDSDLLTLQMLGQLEHWPRDVRIEIRQGMSQGKTLSAIGDALSQVRYTLTRQQQGYVIQGSDIPLPERSMDLYAAVWRLLQPGQRRLLVVAHGDGATLQQLIRAQPLPSRKAVSELLGLTPLPSVAEVGRLQDRHAGYLRGGSDEEAKSTKPFEERIRNLYPEIPDEEVKTFINQRLQHDLGMVLNRLEKEFATLRQELEVWRVQVPSHPTEGAEWNAQDLADQLQWRQQFSDKLQVVWQQKLISSDDERDESFSSFIDFNAELPRMSVTFEHVTELVLDARNPNVILGSFLDSFPNVRYLLLEKVRMDGFATGIFQMRDLRHLILKDCSLRMSETEAEGLSRIETLTLLRLDGNPLGVVPHVGFMRQMKELYLGNTGLSQMPSGVEQLSNLKLLDLRGNNIVDISEDFFEIPDTQEVYVNLIDNPLSPAAVLHINEYLRNASLDREIVIRTHEPVFDDIFELSDFSDSGLGSESSDDDA